MKTELWSELIGQAAVKVRRCIPTRCELCGSWGHSSIGQHWICDSCLSQLFAAQDLARAFSARKSVSFQDTELSQRVWTEARSLKEY